MYSGHRSEKYLGAVVIDVQTTIVGGVKVTETSFHVVVTHLILHDSKLGVNKLPPESFTGASGLCMLRVVVAWVAHTLKALRDIDTRKSDKRDDATNAFEVLVYDRKHSDHQPYHLCLHHPTLLPRDLVSDIFFHVLVVIIIPANVT